LSRKAARASSFFSDWLSGDHFWHFTEIAFFIPKFIAERHLSRVIARRFPNGARLGGAADFGTMGMVVVPRLGGWDATIALPLEVAWGADGAGARAGA
jgi:hypothetical protein